MRATPRVVLRCASQTSVGLGGRRRDLVVDREAQGEPSPGACQQRLDGVFRSAEQCAGTAVGVALQEAEFDRLALSSGQVGERGAQLGVPLAANEDGYRPACLGRAVLW